METIVQDTNDSSILSKYSMVTAGYKEDDFIKYFVQKKIKRAPLINVGYFVRVTIIENTIRYFLKGAVSKVQVLSLGAGFDTTYFKFSTNPYICYYEVDLPGVVKKKIEMICNSDVLSKKISNNPGGISVGKEGEFLNSEHYSIFANDLNQLDDFEKKLMLNGFDFSLPTLVFSECSITYMEAAKSTELIIWMKNMISDSVLIVYEQIHPDDAFGQVMTTHFTKIQNPLKSVNQYKTIDQQIQRYLSSGWTHCDAVNALEMIYALLSPLVFWDLLKKEPFDEFEELHLKCAHYALIIATHSQNYEFWQKFVSTCKIHHPVESSNVNFPDLIWEPLSNIKVERFGHSCVYTNDSSTLIVGGFGCESRKHSKMKTVLHVSLVNEKVTKVSIPLDDNAADIEHPVWDCMYSTCTSINDHEFILYGGRTSPLKPVNSTPWLCRIDWPLVNGIASLKYILKGPINSDIEPVPRWRHSAVLYKPGLVIIYGGLTCNMKVCDDMWLLRISKGTYPNTTVLSWTIPQSHIGTQTGYKPHPTFSHSAAVHNDTMYVSGGYNDSFMALNTLWAFQIDTGWKKIETRPQLKPRYGHTSHVISDKLLIVGGINLNYQDQAAVAIVCLKTFTISEYNIISSDPKMSMLMVHNHISVYRDENQSLYILGGGGNCFSFGTFFNPNAVQLSLNSLT